jgi:hypothetical protein
VRGGKTLTGNPDIFEHHPPQPAAKTPWEPPLTLCERSDQLDAAAEVSPQDLEADRLFWSYWGTPLFNAMLNAKAAPGEG